MIRLDRRILRAAIALVVAAAALVGFNLVAAALTPVAIASQGELDAQRTSAERAIQKIYLAGVGQLHTARGLKHVISDGEAGVIEQRYAEQLKTLRRSALEALGGAFGQNGADAARYAASAEPRLDSASPAPAASPVLLAPRVFVVVDRMQQLTSQLTDTGILEMGQTPSQAPSSGSPRPSPSPTR